MERERMHSTHEFDLGLKLDYAEGTVDPAIRVEAGEALQDRIDELEGGILNDQYTKHVDSTLIPCHCMDCRKCTNGDSVVGVKAAGGSLTGVIADALTLNKFRSAGEKVTTHTKNILSFLKGRGFKIGGHTAVNVPSPEYSGCGAVDKLDNENVSILGFLSRKADRIFNDLRVLNTSAGLGLDISSELEEQIKHNSEQLRDERYATTGKELSEAMEEVAGKESMDELEGPQKAVLAVVMLTPGEVLDTEAIDSKYGDDYQVFEISGWGIENEIRALSVDPKEFNDMFVAALAYQMASSGVIGGPGLKIVFKR